MTLETGLPQTFVLDAHAAPYKPDGNSTWRVKLAFRVDFTNGGYVAGNAFLLDIPGAAVSVQRAAEMLVSSMGLLRAGPVTIWSMQVVRRGEHDDRYAAEQPTHFT